MTVPPITSADHQTDAPDGATVLLHYGDFACPYSLTVVNAIRELEAMGRARYVFRHFPVKMHPHALPCALAAETAARHGRFWPLHDALYAEQPEQPPETILRAARSAGVPEEAVREALEGEADREAVLGQKRAAKEAGVVSTLNLYVGPVDGSGTLYQDEQLNGDLLGRLADEFIGGA